MIKTFIFLSFLPFICLGQEIQGWVAGSTLWGQGNAGISLKLKDANLNISDSFVLDIGDKEIDYNEVELSLSNNKNAIGIRNRWEIEYSEYSPFLGYKTKFKLGLPISLYNEIEFRDVKYDDYFRTSHTLTVVYPNGFLGEPKIKPFVADSIFFNLNDLNMEKNRLYLGYFIYVSKYKFMIYYIPKVWGDTSKEWDDTMKYGASIILKF